MGANLVSNGGDFSVGPIEASEAAKYRDLRLLALRDSPQAFGSSFEEEAAFDEGVFTERLLSGTVFGAWLGEELVGCSGLALRDKAKLRHKGILWGMFVRPDVRGRGAAKQLLNAVIAHARVYCEEVLLTVVAGNQAAHRLYTEAGFIEHGREPAAIKLGSDYYDELLMRLPIRT